MSMALNTTVPTRPTAAAPAMPSVVRAAVHCAGKKATTTAAAITRSASTPSRTRPPARVRDAATKSTTATPVTRPTRAPPVVTERKSERSCAGAAVADMRRVSFRNRTGEVTWRKSKCLVSPGKHQQDREIGDGPYAERLVHAALLRRGG